MREVISTRSSFTSCGVFSVLMYSRKAPSAERMRKKKEIAIASSSAIAYECLQLFLHPTRLRDCPEAGGRAPLDKPAKQRLIYLLLIYLYRIDEAACFREQH